MLLSKQAMAPKMLPQASKMGFTGPALVPRSIRSSPGLASSSSPSHLAGRRSATTPRAVPTTTKEVGKAVQVSIEDGPKIMEDIDCVVFDCDGEWGAVVSLSAHGYATW